MLILVLLLFVLLLTYRCYSGQKKKLSQNGLEDCDVTDAVNNVCVFIPDEEVQGTFASLMYSRRLSHVRLSQTAESRFNIR